MGQEGVKKGSDSGRTEEIDRERDLDVYGLPGPTHSEYFDKTPDQAVRDQLVHC